MTIEQDIAQLKSDVSGLTGRMTAIEEAVGKPAAAPAPGAPTGSAPKPAQNLQAEVADLAKRLKALEDQVGPDIPDTAKPGATPAKK